MAKAKWADASKIPFGKAAAQVKTMSKPKQVRKAATTAGNHLVHQMSSVILQGPEEHHDIASSLQVWHTKNNVHVGVPPNHPNAQAAMDHEWGTQASPPKGVMRSTIRKEMEPTRALFHQSLGGATK